jgi:hypothetical protein
MESDSVIFLRIKKPPSNLEFDRFSSALNIVAVQKTLPGSRITSAPRLPSARMA